MRGLDGVALSEFRLFETEEFARALDRLPPDDREFVQTKLVRQVFPRLREMPFYGPQIAKLRGYDPPTWRYRLGRYRVFFHVDETERVVYLLTLDQRKDAYR
ncbi:MAG: type II toxin-antitoxin system RelE/ParE family toxin [Candidatus Latescibacterota bacterium]|jgi:mRNA interferase RelE/StbE